MTEGIRNPVWDVYDEFRTARLNVLYYESQLKTETRLNATLEWMLAAATSSTVAALWLWQSSIGNHIWKIIGAIAVVLAVGKPILNFPAKVKKKSETLGAYRELDQDFLVLKIKISQKKQYDLGLKKEFQSLLQKKKKILEKYKDQFINQRLRRRCTEQVKQELPIDAFFIPEEE